MTINLNLNNNKKPWFSLNAGGGYQWLLRNSNIISTDFSFSLSLAKFVTGTYHITVPGQPVTDGTYSVTGSFIGLGVNYIITGAKRKIKKLDLQ